MKLISLQDFLFQEIKNIYTFYFYILLFIYLDSAKTYKIAITIDEQKHYTTGERTNMREVR